jgi:anthranilate synthase component 1
LSLLVSRFFLPIIKMKIYTENIRFNADKFTPVGLYSRLRDKHRMPCLLESNDYHDRTDSRSIIGLDPIIEIILSKDQLEIHGIEHSSSENLGKLEELDLLLHSFEFEQIIPENGFFGRFGFEFVKYTETKLGYPKSSLDLPDVHLFLFRYVIILDHFNDEGILLKNSLIANEEITYDEEHALLTSGTSLELPFHTVGNEQSELDEDFFKKLVEKGIRHCQRGDVFQLVLSNSYAQQYFGDDFQVYRKLRQLNPSPYLFYFDFESYRLMGSSPEAQLLIKQQKAEIHPIAGTVRRNNNELQDQKAIEELLTNEKELSEHTMLVDLARNDLSKRSTNVKVEVFRELQRFSHVFHLVSKVTGNVEPDSQFQLFNETFPAGTLSGAPKPKALELISLYEQSTRDYYGGAIGLFLPGYTMNMAIVIRSILSQNGILNYRAGAGVVLDSTPDGEYAEVQNKLRAIRNAIQLTSEIYQENETHSYR